MHELKSRYPAAPEDKVNPTALKDLNAIPHRVKPDNVLKAVTSTQSGSATGLDGIRPLHLQELTNTKTAGSGRCLLAAVTKLVNLLLSGSYPKFARGSFYWPSMCALSENNLACGPSHRRIAVKLADKYGSALVSERLCPKQLITG